jgi:flavodoxin
MKELVIFCLLFICSLEFDTSKMLIIYFSYTGNTQLIVNYIKEISNITSYKIIPKVPYPDYEATIELAHQQLDNDERPEIIEPLTDISKYDTILLGYPLWHSHLPRIVVNQLEKLNFRGKTIYPFNTFGSLGVAESINDIKKYCPNAIVKDGLPIQDSTSKVKEASMKIIVNWLDDNFLEHKNNENERNSISKDNSLIVKVNFILLLLYILF